MRDTFIAESVQLVQNSLWDGLGASGEMKQRSDMVSFRFLRTEESHFNVSVGSDVILLLHSLHWLPIHNEFSTR